MANFQPGKPVTHAGVSAAQTDGGEISMGQEAAEDASAAEELGQGDAENYKAAARKYMEKWSILFESGHYLTALRKTGVEGELRSSTVRSLCWRLYLGCLPEDPACWLPHLREGRTHYERLKKTFDADPRIRGELLDVSLNNPLSQEEESPWQHYFQDNEMKSTIQQDVVRTFPEIEFFQFKMVQEIMVRILFCYGKENPEMAYRQGMHELLAPLLFVLHCDQQAYLHALEFDAESIEPMIGDVLDVAYLEHDVYMLFSHLMKAVESYYQVQNTSSPTGEAHCCLEKSQSHSDDCKGSMVVHKLNIIHGHLLKLHDPDLYEFLEALEIEPQIYGIRWLRVLFGREFPFQDLLVIWDAIFADGSKLELVDFVVVAMLMAIRHKLMEGDYGSCLSLLMHFPPVTDVTQILDHALHLRNPGKYPKPPMVVAPSVPGATIGGRAEIHREPRRYLEVASETRRERETAPRTGEGNGASVKSGGQKKHGGSLPIASFSSRFKSLSTRGAKTKRGQSELVSPEGASKENGFQGGEADRFMSGEEVRQLQSILSCSHSRLSASLMSLDMTLSSAQMTPEAAHAAKDIKEVLTLLNTAQELISRPDYRLSRESGIPPSWKSVGGDSTAMTLFKITDNLDSGQFPRGRMIDRKESDPEASSDASPSDFPRCEAE